MGLTACARVYVAVVNLVFLVIGLALFILGLIFRFGDSVTNEYLQDSVDLVKKTIQDTGGSATDIDIDMNALLFDVSMGLIGSGLFLILISVCGFVGVWTKIKLLLIVYVAICVLLLVGQIVFMVLLYLTTIIEKELISGLKGTIKEFRGLDGSNYESVAWNVMMIYGDCCGVESYLDFQTAASWDKSDNTGSDLLTPIACCEPLPSNATLDCARSPMAATNNGESGCYYKYWSWTLGNAPIMTGIVGGIGLVQILLIISGISVICAERNREKNKVTPMPSPAKQQFNQASRTPKRR